MNHVRVLIADDEPLARDSLALLAAGVPELEVVGTCGDGNTAIEMIRGLRPDLVFLDIQMPHRNGIDVLGELEEAERPAVVFVTAYEQHAVRAFELSAVDYILKPFRDDRFRSAVARATTQIGRRVSVDIQRTPARRLVFRVGRGYLLLEPSQIDWIEAQGDSVRIRSDNQVHLVGESLQSVERRLDPDEFVRIHRSFIVNPANVRRVYPTPHGDYEVQMSDGTKVPLSRSYRVKLKRLLASDK